MIFQFNGRKPIDFENGLVTKAFFVLCDRKPIPDVPKMDSVVLRMKRKVIEDRLPEMSCARQEVLCKVLRHACDTRPIDPVLSWEQTVVRRKQMHIKLAIDEPANVMQNMGRCPLGAGYHIEGSVKYAFHHPHYKSKAKGEAWMH